MDNNLLGFLRHASKEERDELVGDLSVSLMDLYDSVESVRGNTRSLEESIDSMLYGRSRSESEAIIGPRYNKNAKPVYRRMDLEA